METKTNNERLARVEEKLDNNCEKVDELKKDINAGFAKIDSRFDNLDNKYSSKWVEKVVSAMVITILLAVIGAIVSLVVKS